jgi:hypothetical protein
MQSFEIQQLLQDIYKSDINEIQQYNKRVNDQFKLHPELGPCPFEGDIKTSPIVLLLANPGFDERSSLDDHKFKVKDWPLSGLHSKAPEGMSEWWRPRLRVLCEKFGDQYVSSKIAALQLNPWASTKFDRNLRLPSQSKMLEIAEDAARRGAILLVMRAARIWLQADGLRTHPLRYCTKSPRCSYVTEANLGAEAWSKVNAALEMI